MQPSIHKLITERESYWGSLDRQPMGTLYLLLLAFSIISLGIYGAVLGSWGSVRLALYTGVKLPILFLGAFYLVMLFNWEVASLLGTKISLLKIQLVTLTALSIVGAILVGLTCPVLFIVKSAAPLSGSPETMHRAHNIILLSQVGILGIAGVQGLRCLYEGVKHISKSVRMARFLCCCWFLGLSIVGCQLAWIFRPFVGSPYLEVAFMRSNALERNFFEFLFLEVIPFILD